MIHAFRESVLSVYESVRLTVFGFIYDLLAKPTLFQSTFGRRLIRNYSGDAGQHTDTVTGFTGYGLIHYAMVRNLRPARILCIGSRKGFVPGILALAARDNAVGHVDFVDPGFDRTSHPGKSWGGVGFWKKGVAQAHFAKLGVGSRITHYPMTSRAFAKHYPRRKYGYIYIDGDHSYTGVSTDYRMFWPRLVRGGLMVFHDIAAHGKLEGGIFGVHTLWKNIPVEQKICFPFPRQSGLGIVQKP